MRRALLAVCGMVLIAGCGRVPPGPLAQGDFRLYEAASTSSSQLVAVINSRSQATEARLPMGTMSPDGKHLYSISSHTLQDLDPHTGATVRALQLPGSFDLPPATLGGIPGGLSQNGMWLVLITSGVQTTSHMLLISTATFTITKHVDLDGYFEFDAISNDGLRLYVIEYTDATQGFYRVRVYEIDAGQLGAYTIVDKGGAPEPMTGVRLSGVFSPDGNWLYSVYARQGGGDFVHALNLSAPYAYCLDLPGSSSTSDPNDFHWSLALTADGKHLYAANGATGLVMQIDNLDGYNPSIVRTAHIGSAGATASAFVQNVDAKELGAQGAVLSPDGATLVATGTTGLIWIDTTTLHARSSRLTNWTVWSIVASPDGSRVYALSDQGAIAELSMVDGRMGATFNPSVGQPIGLLRAETP